MERQTSGVGKPKCSVRWSKTLKQGGRERRTNETSDDDMADRRCSAEGSISGRFGLHVAAAAVVGYSRSWEQKQKQKLQMRFRTHWQCFGQTDLVNQWDWYQALSQVPHQKHSLSGWKLDRQKTRYPWDPGRVRTS